MGMRYKLHRERKKGAGRWRAPLMKVDEGDYAVAWLTICVSTLRHAST